jgi:hypothetical protein
MTTVGVKRPMRRMPRCWRARRWLSRLWLPIALGACLLAQRAQAHPAPYPHIHPDPYAELPRERLHAYLGVGAHVAPIIESDISSTNDQAHATVGGGGSIFAGVRFGPVPGIEVDYVATIFGTDNPNDSRVMRLQIFDFGLTLNVPTRGIFEPRLQLAIGGAVLDDEFGTVAEGTAYAAGIGGDFWVHPNFTIGVRAIYRAAILDRVLLGFRDDTVLSFLGLELLFAGRL